MWEGKEGGNWHNTAKYNPLNTSYQTAGSVNFNTGKSGSGVQGVAATISTLTGAQADARGYTAIVNALKGGGVSNEEFLKLMQGSSWDAGRYKGGSSTSSHRISPSLAAVWERCMRKKSVRSWIWR